MVTTSSYGLDVHIYIPPKYNGDVEGICGNADGTPEPKANNFENMYMYVSLILYKPFLSIVPFYKC